MITYVYEGTEVRKTGREATRKLRVANKETTLVEITPVDSAFDWKKWVDPNILFIVQPDKQEG